MQVKIKKTDERLGIKEGEVYLASCYPYDNNKYALEECVTSGYRPECFVYLHEVVILKKRKNCEE